MREMYIYIYIYIMCIIYIYIYIYIYICSIHIFYYIHINIIYLYHSGNTTFGIFWGYQLSIASHVPGWIPAATVHWQWILWPSLPGSAQRGHWFYTALRWMPETETGWSSRGFDLLCWSHNISLNLSWVWLIVWYSDILWLNSSDFGWL